MRASLKFLFFLLPCLLAMPPARASITEPSTTEPLEGGGFLRTTTHQDGSRTEEEYDRPKEPKETTRHYDKNNKIISSEEKYSDGTKKGHRYYADGSSNHYTTNADGSSEDYWKSGDGTQDRVTKTSKDGETDISEYDKETGETKETHIKKDGSKTEKITDSEGVEENEYDKTGKQTKHKKTPHKKTTSANFGDDLKQPAHAGPNTRDILVTQQEEQRDDSEES